MPVVFYAESQDQSIVDSQYQDAIRDLVNKDFVKGQNPETLASSSDRPIYSLRLTGKARLIYTYFIYHGERHPLILEIDENHNYDSKYLKKGVLKRFFDKNAKSFKDKIERSRSEEATSSEQEALTFVPVTIIGENVIILDDEQKNIHVPSIVEGPPGSGKTCVGYHMLETYVRNNADNLADKKILYVTKSGNLVQHINRCWEQSPDKPDTHNPLDILTYDDLLAKFNGNEGARKDGEAVFKQWYANNVSSKVKGKAKKGTQLLGSDADLVWQTFRRQSGYEEVKEVAGDKQRTLSPEKYEKAAALYEQWMAYCKDNHLQFTEFAKINEIPEEQQYDIIFVDESQDLSTQALANLLKLARNYQIVYALDSRQNLQDSLSKTDVIKDIFYQSGISVKKVEVVQLKGSYRCNYRVMKLAKVINELRINLTPEDKRKEGSINIIEAGEPGEVVILEPNKEETLQSIHIMAGNADVCIITTADEKAKIEADPSKKKWRQVFTPEEVKGLEYKTVILYNILSKDVFSVINRAMESEQRDWGHATHLNGIFAAITRAEEAVYVYQENPRPVQRMMNIIESFKSEETNEDQKQRSEHQSTAEEWLERAKLLLENNRGHALNILEKELHYTDLEIQNWLRANDPSFGVSASPTPIKRNDTEQVKQSLTEGQRKNRLKKVRKCIESGVLDGVKEGLNILSNDLGYSPEVVTEFLIKNKYLNIKGLDAKDLSIDSLAQKIIEMERVSPAKKNNTSLEQAIQKRDFKQILNLVRTGVSYDWNLVTNKGDSLLRIMSEIKEQSGPRINDAITILKELSEKNKLDFNAEQYSEASAYPGQALNKGFTYLGQALINEQFTLFLYWLQNHNPNLEVHFGGISLDIFRPKILRFIRVSLGASGGNLLPEEMIALLETRDPKYAHSYAIAISRIYFKSGDSRKDRSGEYIVSIDKKIRKETNEDKIIPLRKLFALLERFVDIGCAAQETEALIHKAVFYELAAQREKNDPSSYTNHLLKGSNQLTSAANSCTDCDLQQIIVRKLEVFKQRYAEATETDSDIQLKKVMGLSEIDDLIALINENAATLDKFNWNLKSDSGKRSPLILLANSDHPGANEALRILSGHERFDVNETDAEGRTVFNCLLESEKWDKVTVLLDSRSLDFSRHALIGGHPVLSERLFLYCQSAILAIPTSVTKYFATHAPMYYLSLAEYLACNLLKIDCDIEAPEFIEKLYDLEQQSDEASIVPLGLVRAYISSAAYHAIPLAQCLWAQIELRVERADENIFVKYDRYTEIYDLLEAAEISGLQSATRVLEESKKAREAVIVAFEQEQMRVNTTYSEILRTHDVKALEAILELDEDTLGYYPLDTSHNETGINALMLIARSKRSDRRNLFLRILETETLEYDNVDADSKTAFVHALEHDAFDIVNEFFKLDDFVIKEHVHDKFMDPVCTGLIQYIGLYHYPLDLRITDYLERHAPHRLYECAVRLAKFVYGIDISNDIAPLVLAQSRTRDKHKLGIFRAIKSMTLQAYRSGVKSLFYSYAYLVGTDEDIQEPVNRIDMREYALTLLEKQEGNYTVKIARCIIIIKQQLSAIYQALNQIPNPTDQTLLSIIKAENLDALYELSLIDSKKFDDCNLSVACADTGMTLLMVACRAAKYPSGRKLKIVQFLLAHGVDQNAFDAKNNNAYIYAGIISKDPEILYELIRSNASCVEALPPHADDKITRNIAAKYKMVFDGFGENPKLHDALFHSRQKSISVLQMPPTPATASSAKRRKVG